MMYPGNMRRISGSTTPFTISGEAYNYESSSYSDSGDSVQIMNLDTIFDSVDTPGLNIWRVHSNDLEPVKENDHGFFHEEAVYVLLKIDDDGSAYLHHWRGRLSTKVDKDRGHDRCNQIDEHFGGAHVFSFEFQGHESSCFMKLFPEGLVYVEGNPITIPRRAAKYHKRLYTIDGRDYIRAQCVEPYVEELSSLGAAILDGFPRFYVWIGDQCPYPTRVKAIDLARKMRNTQRKGQVHIVVIDSTDLAAQKSFLKKLGLRGDIAVKAIDCSNYHDSQTKVVLHRLSGRKVLYDMPVVSKKPLDQKYLVRTDAYLLDRGPEKPVYVWVGHLAASRDLAEAVTRGMIFSNYHSYPSHKSMCRVKGGWETDEFKQSFINWHNYYIKSANTPRCSTSISKKSRTIPSRSEYRSYYDVRSDGIINDDKHIVEETEESTEIWKIMDDNLESVPWDRQGIFTNGSCYLVLHHRLTAGILRHTLYYWLGKNSSLKEQQSAVKLSQSMNYSLQNTATVIRILDGKESPHFLAALQHSMIVYDSTVKIT
ncbi:villin-1 [Patella vulgata]|uniref:villin-1 n=1 Tax=Patella vulgata TaxID=6465 RepID=UPI0024A8E95E|nr:villin-1 [Patella vulgata]